MLYIVLIHVCIPAVLEVETRGGQVEDPPGLHVKLKASLGILGRPRSSGKGGEAGIELVEHFPSFMRPRFNP